VYIRVVKVGQEQARESGILMCWMYMCLLWLWLL